MTAYRCWIYPGEGEPFDPSSGGSVIVCDEPYEAACAFVRAEAQVELGGRYLVIVNVGETFAICTVVATLKVTRSRFVNAGKLARGEASP